MKRYIIILLVCLYGCVGGFSTMLRAQALGEWQVYPSYQIATRNVVVGSSVYSLMNGNLLRYDIEDQSVKLYDNYNDLNDFQIRSIAYSEEAKRLILVYKNGNIDLLDLEDNVLNISAYKDKSISGKDVNGISVCGTNAYLGTGFGIVVVDLKEGVIRETYNLGVEVQSVSVAGDIVWLGCRTGLYTSSLSSESVLNFSTWKKHSGAGNWITLIPSGNDVYAMNKNGVFHFYQTSYVTIKNGTYVFLRQSPDGQLCFGNNKEVNIYSDDTTGKTYTFPNTWNDVSLGAGASKIFWVSDGESGLRNYALKDGEIVAVGDVIQPNSPRRDLFYRMHYDTDGHGGYRLLVAGGINTYLGIFNAATAMIYEDGKWTYLDEKGPAEKYPELLHYNTTDIVQDPDDPKHIYASPYRTGLYEYQDGKFVDLYNCWNSPLASILPDIPKYMNYVSATCLSFDDDRNLWMCNQETDTIIRVLTPNKKWISLYYEEIAEETQCDGYLFSTSGINFLACRRLDARGFFAFDTKGTLSNVRDDRHKLLSTIVNQDGTSYSPHEFHCLAEDLNGHIWCGTDQGLFVIDNPADVFDSDFHFTQIKIARNDGSGLADYLLNGVSIQCIAVDGGNRKWIGTDGNGIYLVSADGTEMIHHFMESDSPLLSDNVQCIAIHPRTGMVMIGTDKGLCSFMADATEAEKDLVSDNVIAYPNPVRPDFTGLIRIDGLTFNAEVKICSVTGQLVWSGVSNGGTCTWNGCNKQGRRVSSGIYNVISNTENGEKAIVTKIIVIK